MDSLPHPVTHTALLDAAVHGVCSLAGRLNDTAIYITGGSGFLAASLVVFLHELNREAGLNLRLYASARRPVDQVPLFDFLKLHPDVAWEVVPVETARIPNEKRLIVIHTASYGSPRDYLRRPVDTFEANTTSLVRLFQQCHSDRVVQFVFFSSAEIYGQPPDTAIPTPEPFVGGVDTLATRSIYAESKRMGEVLGVFLAQDLGIPFTVLRPWNIYGPGQRLEDGRVPMEFVRHALQERIIRLTSNGTPRRTFCYVWDGVRQIVSTLGRTTPVEAFNIGHSGEEVSILDLARYCAAACGLPATVVRCDPTAKVTGLSRCAPDTRAVEALATEPWAFTQLTIGLRILRDWAEFAANR